MTIVAGPLGRPVTAGHAGLPATLADLLALSAAGDEAAFAELYRVASPRLLGMAVKVLGHQAHAEEVTQEVFLDIWTSSARFEPGRGSAMSWMLTIAHRRSVDRVRNAEAVSRRDDGWLRDLDLETDDCTPVAAGAAIDATRVRDAVRDLSPKQRTAIFLRYFAGQSNPELADYLGIPVGTAKTRVRDGLASLNTALSVPVVRTPGPRAAS